MRNEHAKPLCHYPIYTQRKDMMAELASNVSFALVFSPKKLRSPQGKALEVKSEALKNYF